MELSPVVLEALAGRMAVLDEILELRDKRLATLLERARFAPTVRTFCVL